jgi:hypothetical protein
MRERNIFLNKWLPRDTNPPDTQLIFYLLLQKIVGIYALPTTLPILNTKEANSNIIPQSVY